MWPPQTNCLGPVRGTTTLGLYPCMKQTLRLAAFLCLALAVEASAAVRWTKVSSPYFTIYTSDSVDQAKEWAAGLEAFRLSLNELAPTDERLLDPMTLVVFARLKAFQAIVPRSGRGKSGDTQLYRYVNRNGHFIGALNAEDEDLARFAIYMQGGLWLTNSYRRPLPLWLSTGLQGVYATSVLSDGRMTIGYKDERIAYELDEGARLIEWERMIGMTTEAETYQREPGKFNAQAWAFVHYLLLGDKGANRPKLARFMNAILAGQNETEALQAAFPEGIEVLAKNLSRYVRRGVYPTTTLPADLHRIEREIHAAPASEAEMQLALGYLHLYFQNAGVAAPYFERALTLAPGAAAGLEAMAELAEVQGDQSESLGRYEAAVAAGSKSYIAHFRAAYPAIQAMYGLEAAVDNVDQVQARAAVDRIEEILRLRPGFGAAQEALAGMAGALAKMTEEDGRWLKEGAERFSDDARVQAGMVAYEIATKRYAPAKARLDRLYEGEFAHTDRVQVYVKKLHVRLAAVNDLYWCERYFAEQKTAEAAKFLPRLDRAPLLPAERERFAAVRSALTTHGTLQRVRELIAQRNLSLANLLLDNLAADNPPEALRVEIAKLREQTQPENKKAPAEAGAGN